MSSIKRILEMARNNDGIVTSAMVTEAKILRGNLKYLADKGILQVVKRGVYRLSDEPTDEYLIFQNRFSRGIYSHESALYLLHLVCRPPHNFSLTFPATCNVMYPRNLNTDCYTQLDRLYNCGIVEVESPSGNPVKCYNAEKTLCDILRRCSQTEIDIIWEAYYTYLSRDDRNIPLLMEYAKKTNMSKKVRRKVKEVMADLENPD